MINLDAFLVEVQMRTSQDLKPLQEELTTWTIEWCHEMKLFCVQMAFQSLLHYEVITKDIYNLLIDSFKRKSFPVSELPPQVKYMLRKWKNEI